MVTEKWIIRFLLAYVVILGLGAYFADITGDLTAMGVSDSIIHVVQSGLDHLVGVMEKAAVAVLGISKLVLDRVARGQLPDSGKE